MINISRLAFGIVLSGLLGIGGATAAPFLPTQDAHVLERLPQTATSPELRQLRALREQLKRTPDDLALAVEAAWGYVRLGRTEADPRYYGYAQAALQRWWEQPPPSVLLLRATLRQNRHDFSGALDDLTHLLQLQPRNAQAWLTHAVIQAVRGEPAAAAHSCLALARLSDALLLNACLANAWSLNGRAEQAYRLLQQTLAAQPQAPVAERLWALTLLAKISLRLGREEDSAAHFQEALALGQRDLYLLNAYADYLLDQGRAAEVRTLLKGETRVDSLLLRLALAEQQLGAPELAEHRAALHARIQAARLRGDASHLGDAARFTLTVLGQPQEALQLALANWAQQREPGDARLVLEAALAARNPGAAQPVLDWLRQQNLEDVRLTALTQRLAEIDG